MYKKEMRRVYVTSSQDNRSFDICKSEKKKIKRNTTPVLAVKTLAFTRCIRGNEYHRRNRS